MIVIQIILFISLIIGLFKAFEGFSKYAQDNYDFNISTSGLLSLIPPALVLIGYIVVHSQGKSYWKALQEEELNIVVSLTLATVAFIWIFIRIWAKTNLVIAIGTMLFGPLYSSVTVILVVMGGLLAGAALSTPVGWLFLIFLVLAGNSSKK